ncbi:MAG: hypothetical protein KAR20_01080, partial [Candidatus Heimdallarchaeota archaeon]|nr:hypothetical protein [Candidatus Heimdallarchaeota archaeon]
RVRSPAPFRRLQDNVFCNLFHFKSHQQLTLSLNQKENQGSVSCCREMGEREMDNLPHILD